ncbi:hypothetical protein BRADI_2g33423v3 [Brachypodium distachyon]|uniref:Zinc finger GRF-type domain-containing protein n=1 Tax=Brachypodium distachyon TaxID=15368 RepID=A0A2K2DBK9_BRADI|nr:hypothetical protein BRADI_2g33423v3 [Brachypodium distachyon]
MMGASSNEVQDSRLLGEGPGGRRLGTKLPLYTDDLPTIQADCSLGSRCRHGLLPMSRVSLEGKSTGRRFFGCPFEEMEDCGYVY